MNYNVLVLFLLGNVVRLYISTTDFSETLGKRVEITTPLNSFKRVQEGVYLYNQKIDPYQGDMVHEMPLVLVILATLFKMIPKFISTIYILIDLLTATLLYRMSRIFITEKIKQEKTVADKFAKDTEVLQLDENDAKVIPKIVLIAYLFNPMTIFNCAGLTSTVFSNCLLALTLYFLSKRQLIPSLLFLSIETMRNLYPFVLIAPIILTFAKNSFKRGFFIGILYVGFCGIIALINFYIMNSWSFLDGTLGFIFFYRDLQPNIGLFWYFFTEMFDHFRTMFLITFQMNATILYLLPLSFKLRKEPMLLATVLLALTATFRSYPCLGDISFYIALLPIWKRCWKFMAHNFVVFCIFIVTLCMMPVLWHLWIYSGSANANFFFGTTLAFSTGQIFLLTDLIFAHVKREFCLKHGQKIYINGKEAKITLS